MTEKMEFGVRVAGMPFLIRTGHEKTKTFFRDFSSEPDSGEKATLLEASIDELAMAEKKYIDTLKQEGLPVPDRISICLPELTVIHEKMTLALLDRNIFLLHGSALCMDGRAYIFTAPSGTGKSTHTRLWREVYGDRVQMINDDKPFIRFDALRHAFLVCGSPWKGKHGLGTDMEAPLRGLCILHRAAENRIRRLAPEEAMPELIQQIYWPAERDHVIKTLSFASDLLKYIPVYDLLCNMDPGAARLSYRVLAGEEKESSGPH